MKFDGYNFPLLWNKPVVGYECSKRTNSIENRKPNQFKSKTTKNAFGLNVFKSFFDSLHSLVWFGLPFLF